ncbi:MAG: acetylesterase [Erysipelotrichaceae bacterium]|nr:acetylesterase [Erysipelotrichaceae bacterium]
MALIRMDFVSESLMRTVTINCIVPVDKIRTKPSEKPFKTLYLLHGIFGNYTDWVSGTRIQRWAEEHDLAVIMPSGENKFYVDNPRSNDNFSAFIGKELVEVTRRAFPLSHKKEDTFLAGLSMGGYGAIVNGLKYFDTFGYIAGLSSGFILDTVEHSTEEVTMITRRRSYYESVFGDLTKLRGSDKDYFHLAKVCPKEKRPHVFLTCGTEDFLLDANVEYHRYLQNLGYDVTWTSDKGGHEWDYWDRHIHEVLQWLPLEKEHKGTNSGNVK